MTCARTPLTLKRARYFGEQRSDTHVERKQRRSESLRRLSLSLRLSSDPFPSVFFHKKASCCFSLRSRRLSALFSHLAVRPQAVNENTEQITLPVYLCSAGGGGRSGGGGAKTAQRFAMTHSRCKRQKKKNKNPTITTWTTNNGIITWGLKKTHKIVPEKYCRLIQSGQDANNSQFLRVQYNEMNTHDFLSPFFPVEKRQRGLDTVGSEKNSIGTIGCKNRHVSVSFSHNRYHNHSSRFVF